MEKSESKMNKEIRRWRTFRRRGVFVGIFMLVLAVFIMAGTSRADRMRSVTIKKSKTQINDVRRQRTDGNIVFCVPKGFSCKDSVFAGCRLFFLEDESETEITLNSGFDSDDSPEHINFIYNDLGGEAMEGYESTVVADVTKSDKRVTKCIRVKKYTGQGIVVYWRFAALFDKETGMMCLVSAYDNGNGNYLEPLLESVRFNRSSRK
ncbi:hypothetical protein [uncultured Prevotella sp.]|uniref:hypothetical protein n=2 Tax=uncultured Prevotella sp. TaxID=159272 RepID=UPI002605E294|nr:hypothetical protein [uncultured Prevotella sp.]